MCYCPSSRELKAAAWSRDHRGAMLTSLSCPSFPRYLPHTAQTYLPRDDGSSTLVLLLQLAFRNMPPRRAHRPDQWKQFLNCVRLNTGLSMSASHTVFWRSLNRVFVPGIWAFLICYFPLSLPQSQVTFKTTGIAFVSYCVEMEIKVRNQVVQRPVGPWGAPGTGCHCIWSPRAPCYCFFYQMWLSFSCVLGQGHLAGKNRRSNILFLRIHCICKFIYTYSLYISHIHIYIYSLPGIFSLLLIILLYMFL